MTVAIVGAGIAGAACAAALRGAGVDVEVFERGRAPGGRLASPRVHGRRVDLGAAYFTVSDDGFRGAVDRWAAAGLTRQWTDTLDAVDGRAPAGTASAPARPPGRTPKPGPVRWAAPDGLRSLARAEFEAAGAQPAYQREITRLDELSHDAVVLAMPDPQAARLLGGELDWVDYAPVISVAAGWSRRRWARLDAVFVNDDPDITLVADDGARRGDGAPVLVAHTGADRARRHLDAPDDAVPAALAAIRRVLGVDAVPEWTHAHRWTFAKPAATHGDAPFAVLDRTGTGSRADRVVGVCGDSWCPSGSPRVEAAWLSGTRLGWHLADRFA